MDTFFAYEDMDPWYCIQEDSVYYVRHIVGLPLKSDAERKSDELYTNHDQDDSDNVVEISTREWSANHDQDDSYNSVELKIAMGESALNVNLSTVVCVVLCLNEHQSEKCLSIMESMIKAMFGMLSAYIYASVMHDRSKAVEILVKDLKVFFTFNEELFKEITQLLTLENFRENEQLSKYGDTKSARAIMLVELKKLIEANPLFRVKLQFPNLRNSRLRTLINQSLNWQHQLCKNPRPNPDIKTLFVDHSCGQPNGAQAPSPANNPLFGALPKAGGFPPLGAHGPFQPPQAQAPVSAPLAGWMSSSSTVAHPAASGGGPIGLGGPSMPATLKHPRTPPSNPALDYPSGDSDHVAKRTRSLGITDESYLLIIVDIPQVNLPVNVMPVSFQSHGHGPAFNAPDDLPKTAARTLNQGSSPMKKIK
ncbi:hypothetical protein ACFE04_008567 [Oxalis oulophora]